MFDLARGGRVPAVTRRVLLGLVLAVVAASPAQGASPFEWRGVVEGAYGPAWDHAQRTRVIEWMPAHGFNAYEHAPKDDLFQRTQCSEPYQADQQRDFADENAR